MYFEHDYSEEEKGKRVRKAMQSERFPPDYSQRVYGQGGLLPRFLSHHRGTGTASPMYVYRYDMMRETLDKFRDWEGDPHEALLIEYVDPTTGGPVYKTITFFAQMLRPGERTLPLKQNASLSCAPFEGRGHSIVDGERLDWEPFDTFAVPGGSWCEHVNLSDKDPAILFVASDEPTLKALAFYQKHGKTIRRGRSARLSRDRSRSRIDQPSWRTRKNTKPLAHFDCPGGGQVWVEGTSLYIGHMRQPSGTTIVDVADPRQPTVLGAHRDAARLAFAQGARRQRHHDRQPRAPGPGRRRRRSAAASASTTSRSRPSPSSSANGAPMARACTATISTAATPISRRRPKAMSAISP